MKYLIITCFAVMAFISCGDDDNYQILDYQICVDEIIAEANIENLTSLQLAEWPSDIRSYITSEFPGYSISSMETYNDANAVQYILATMDNGGLLLFDESNTFICGDNSFQNGNGDDEYDEEYINIEDLPQSIKDYIATNYPNNTIKKAEFEDGEYEVKLDGDIELCFDAQGNFIGEC